MQHILLVFLGAAIVNNFVLTRFLGICPFLGVTKEVNASFGMGVAVTFVMTVSTLIVWPLYHFVLIPLGLAFLQYVFFILTIAVLVQLLDIVLKTVQPALHNAFGIYLALITTNCAILGVILLTVAGDETFGMSIVFAPGAGAGYTLALTMMAAIQEELEFADIPTSLQGPAISLIIAGLMALAFIGFSGLGTP